jgi:hypothetical protein
MDIGYVLHRAQASTNQSTPSHRFLGYTALYNYDGVLSKRAHKIAVCSLDSQDGKILCFRRRGYALDCGDKHRLADGIGHRVLTAMIDCILRECVLDTLDIGITLA